MATVYIVWDREKKIAVPGTFPSSADGTAHATRLTTRENRSGKASTKDAVAVTV
jgi:hypothetical protein